MSDGSRRRSAPRSPRPAGHELLMRGGDSERVVADFGGDEDTDDERHDGAGGDPRVPLAPGAEARLLGFRRRRDDDAGGRTRGFLGSSVDREMLHGGGTAGVDARGLRGPGGLVDVEPAAEQLL